MIKPKQLDDKSPDELKALFEMSTVNELMHLFKALRKNATRKKNTPHQFVTDKLRLELFFDVLGDMHNNVSVEVAKRLENIILEDRKDDVSHLVNLISEISINPLFHLPIAKNAILYGGNIEDLEWMVETIEVEAAQLAQKYPDKYRFNIQDIDPRILACFDEISRIAKQAIGIDCSMHVFQFNVTEDKHLYILQLIEIINDNVIFSNGTIDRCFEDVDHYVQEHMTELTQILLVSLADYLD